MKKIGIYISFFMKEVLENDKENFNIELGAIGNRIFEYYSSKEIEKNCFKTRYSEKIQFNLNKINEEMFFKVLKEQNYESESEYMRDVILTYINNPRYIREEILFSQNFIDIQNAIEKNRKLNIKYNKKVRTVNPYFIKVADRENRSYLFAYCEDNEDYRCYRISEIESILISKSEREIKDKKYIEEIYKNFDPFRSYGKRVKVKITEEGKKLLEKAITNRPKIISQSGEIIIFEADERLAQIYFAQFFSEIEILEPLNLREWFKEVFKKTYEKYI